jgi:site-specific DNA recombinase
VWTDNDRLNGEKKGIYYYKCRTNGCKVNRSTKGMHELFRNVLKTFQIGKEEVDSIKVQLEEQMAVFFNPKWRMLHR